MSVSDHLIYAMFWLVFGVVHSLLAGPKMKQQLKSILGGGYRFAYNLFALFHIVLVIYGGRYLLANELPVLPFPMVVFTLLKGMMIVGALLVVASLFQYDLGRFSGWTQLRYPELKDSDEPLHLSGFHRYVRHPLYTGAHLYLWGSIQTEFDLVTAVWASAYLIIGSVFEERKLIATYGDAYSQYKREVPSVIPWRGRAI